MRDPLYDPRRPSEFMRAVAQEQRQVKLGVAGQEAGPPGLGPEPKLEHQPGGALLNLIQHPAFDTFEHLFRRLPEQAWTSPLVSTSKPVSFEIGTFKVPSQQYALVADYQFSALRQSGVDPFDFVEAAPYRFSGFMGFDITVSGRRMSNLFYQLDPAPVTFARQEFQAPIGDTRAPATIAFNSAGANNFGNTAGAGSSLLPVRPNVQGAREMPFTLIAEPGDFVTLSCVIFRRVSVPLAAIQASCSGYTIHANTMSALLDRMRPR